MRWSIITGEYPPQRGGVADYSRLVAQGLAQSGDEVEVWAPRSIDPRAAEPPIVVHDLADHFGPRAILELKRSLKPNRESGILVQYVPHAFGMKALNMPFCLWLYSMRRAEITLMFHEVAYPIQRNQPLKHNLLGAANRVMASLAARSARRIFISTPAWMNLVRSLAPGRARIEWLPVPSNVVVSADRPNLDIRSAFAPDRRRLIGHFGTYGSLIAETLGDCIRALAARKNDHSILLMGRGSTEFRERLLARDPTLSGSVHATGGLNESALSRHVAACDLMVQPYPDGVSSRRTTIMLPLAHGIPTVTNSGAATERCWSQGAVVLCPGNSARLLAQTIERLLVNENELCRLRAESRKLYAELFDISHTIETLRRP